jgi:hypothetical protein
MLHHQDVYINTARRTPVWYKYTTIAVNCKLCVITWLSPYIELYNNDNNCVISLAQAQQLLCRDPYDPESQK